MSDELRSSKEQLLDELIDAARSEPIAVDEHFMTYAHKCAESDRRRSRTSEARAAVLAALSEPPSGSQSEKPAPHMYAKCVAFEVYDKEGTYGLTLELPNTERLVIGEIWKIERADSTKEGA